MADEIKTVEHHHTTDSGGNNPFVIVVIAVALIILGYFIYAGALRTGTNSGGGTESGDGIEIEIPDQIDVNVNQGDE
jgi:hypothetical protein